MIHPVVPTLAVVIGMDCLAEHASTGRREGSTFNPGGPDVVDKFADGWDLVVYVGRDSLEHLDYVLDN